ncbi:hypothetical protein BRADI_3g08168v3 [Brachypodium distachyon]|uniref:Interferon-related developmental regulator N-terminal domain-containing protein n=1 Tax=Brachypodium distachyon TaxID=15368 RepID=A0A2K2CVX2_BRADI|nr:hypothetical protein BRADI_3g08168v3 [Brachypodium distachyon]
MPQGRRHQQVHRHAPREAARRAGGRPAGPRRHPQEGPRPRRIDGVAHRGLTGAVAALSISPSEAATAVAAIDCLAAVAFACARWPWDANPAMGAIHGVINKLAGTTATGSSEVLISAVSAWALLAATVAYTPSSSMTPWRGLTELLDSDDPAVLLTAAEALAVCAERNLTEIASSSSAEDVHALKTKVSILAAEARGRGVDKKAHAKQTRLFAQIDDMMKHGARGRPRKAMLRTSTTSTSGGCLLEAPRWARRAQLKFLTRFLGDGFGTHSRFNPLIHEDSDSDDDESGSDDCESGSDDDGCESESDGDGSDSGPDDCESGSDDHGDPDSCSAAAYEEFLLTGFFLDGTAGADEEFVMVDHDENEEFVMV